MKRREFLENACVAGLCGCAVASLIASAVRAEESKPAPEPAPKPSDGRIRFAQERYAKLLTALSSRADAGAVDESLQDVGRYCAQSWRELDAYAGKPEAFVAFIREKWHAHADYDPEKGTVSLAFPPLKECPCALVKRGVTPPVVCQCSIGWQKQVFGAVFGRPVEVKLNGSLLRGAGRCSFEIRRT